ncbi:aminoglycoside phosphotransferase family protein [Yoonia vestfoldensis]|uniref:Phosphotransferase enzyme family protein n=1 Tax=Yoonia vestfoldensis TaxID=245188 RepID=A0A1Y0EH05_9RHOB|nr:phosphotransferase [Yoonia vestfoldensis]ARU02864.1 phosphotransferase enzyme family protein [Yoonia vestfoldensis]
MSDRSRAITAFLAQTGHDSWQQHPIAADASGRNYLRLSKAAQTLILMDAPPEAGEDVTPFVAIAGFLADAGLHPPAIVAQDRQAGLLLLTDLGRDSLAQWLDRHPAEALPLYRASTDVLAHLAKLSPPALTRLTPQVAGEMVAITGTHYAQRPLPDLVAAVTAAMAALAPRADRLALRDYHAENLIWRPDLDGLARVGLLDFQDAFVAPLGYDLASLLRDARRDVPEDICAAMIAHFMAATGAGADFPAQLACLGAQRNLRILGVFARLATAQGKTRYIAMIPRVWAQLQKDLAHPALADLRNVVADLLPPPDAALLARLRR